MTANLNLVPQGKLSFPPLVRLKPWLLLLLIGGTAAQADDIAALVQARAAIERVYYNHRLGQKPPFEQVTPQALVERLVKEDLHKEAVLRKVYGVEITPARLAAEVQRINTTTRAPDMLAEIKAALDNDPAKLAQAFAKPFVVERLLRDKFENDDALHAAPRREVETVRNRLLQAVAADGRQRPNVASESERRLASATTKARVAGLLAILKTGHSNSVTETTWHLGARPAETNTPVADELEIKRRFGPDAQVISSPHRAEKDRMQYLEELPAELQRVLRVQLRQPGDVTAVIETPGGFLLYLAEDKSDTALTVACLSLPKRSYEQWLSEQPGESN